MDLHSILTRSPIDAAARRVTSGGVEVDGPMTREELAALVHRTARKQRLLKLVLGIKTKAQRKNVAYKASKGIPQFRANKEPRAFTEYLRCGREIQRLTRELAAMRKVRQFVARAEQECRALMETRTT